MGASKAGVEDIWHQVRGERLSGRQIAARLHQGDAFALGLYLNSARITAHAVMGLASAFGLPRSGRELIVVGHGGIFHVPRYGEWLSSALSRAAGREPRITFTKGF